MRFLIPTICILGLIGMIVGIGVFAGEISLPVSVTPVVISVTIEPDSIDYGEMGVDETKVSPTIVLTNQSDAQVDVSVRSADTQDWTLSDEEAGTETYIHQVVANSGEWPVPEDEEVYGVVAISVDNKELTYLQPIEEEFDYANLLFKIHTPVYTVATETQITAITLIITFSE